MNNNTAILLIHCPDKQGIVAKVTEFLDNNRGNILFLDQHVDLEEKVFFMRVEWELDKFLIPNDKIADFFQIQIGQLYNMKFNLYFSSYTHRMALFVSKMPHCMFDIIARYMDNEWNVEIPLIISNHQTLEPMAQKFGIPFQYVPVSSENKVESEKKQFDLLKEYKIDFIVLARYMQILSGNFTDHFPNKVINIHHSFLPAFPGAKPYHSAYKRGVKIIGATSHYVTTDLDEGPIIEQDVTRISHKDSIDNLVMKGRDLEKIVLSRAISLHLQHKTIVYNNKTVVFN